VNQSKKAVYNGVVSEAMNSVVNLYGVRKAENAKIVMENHAG